MIRLVDIFSPQSFSGAGFLMERNVLNADEVRKEINELSALLLNPAARNWFRKQLFSYVINRMNDANFIQQADPEKLAGAPAWARNPANNSPLYQIDIEGFVDAAGHDIGDVIRWLNHLYQTNPPSRIPYTWEQALAKSTEKEIKPPTKYKPMEGETVIKKYGDGFSWVELKTEECKQAEGERMGHCLQNAKNAKEYGYIISLRDKANVSHMTLELDEDNNILQIEGRAKTVPKKKYVKYFIDLMNSHELKVDTDEVMQGEPGPAIKIMAMEIEQNRFTGKLSQYSEDALIKSFDNGYTFRVLRSPPEEGESLPPSTALGIVSGKGKEHKAIIPFFHRVLYFPEVINAEGIAIELDRVIGTDIEEPFRVALYYLMYTYGAGMDDGEAWRILDNFVKGRDLDSDEDEDEE